MLISLQVDYLNDAGKGINEAAIELFKADNAWETYHTFYDQLAVTNASVWDYYNSATKDYDEMVADQKAGRKIKMPTHVEYSHYNLVAMSGFDVPKIWKKYVEKSAHLTTGGVFDGQGHFIVELAPEETVDQLNRFMDRLKVKSALGHDEL